MIGSTNIKNGGTKSTIIVSIVTGSIVAAYTDAACTVLVKNAVEKSSGKFWLTGLDNRTYYIKATLNGDEAVTSYTITEYGVYRINMVYRPIPEFTYSGTYEVVEDDDTIISDIANYKGNWKIRFLTSGTLSFSNLYEAVNGIDVFLVGGGAGSSEKTAGGYTLTSTINDLSTGTDYTITIGAGTTGNTDGGNSSAFGETANGGKHGYVTGSGPWKCYGGNGGSGGSLSAASAIDGANGNAGTPGTSVSYYIGTGQGTTTREFGESTGKLYATSGGNNHTGNRANNTGDGAFNSTGAVGGSGIVIIRNTRS